MILKGLAVTFALVAVFVGIAEWSRFSQSRRVPLDFKNAKVLITGASSGIGKAMVLKLCEKGAEVYIVSRRLEALREVAKECISLGGKDAHVIASDVTTREGQQKVISLFGPHSLDVIVLNHGATRIIPFDLTSDSDLDSFEHAMNLNYFSYVRLIRGLFLAIRPNGGAVAMGSLAGAYGVPHRSGYTPSKWALRGLWSTLRAELAKKHNIFFTYLLPGYVLTEAHDLVSGARRHHLDEWMTAEKCAEISLDAISRGVRESRMDWLPTIMEYLDGVQHRTGLFDPLIEQKAKRLLKYEPEK